MDVMFEVPSNELVESVVINKKCVLGKQKPILNKNPDKLLVKTTDNKSKKKAQ